MGGIVVLAISAILAVLAYYSSKPAFPSTNGTWVIAVNLANGRGYTACVRSYFPFCGPTNQVTAMREPIPVLLMAAAMKIYPSKYSGIVMQCLLYLGTLCLIYAILKKYDQRIALLAALLWVISKAVVAEIPDDSGELAAAFFLSLGLFYFMKGRNEPRMRNWILSGVFLGLASLSRTVLLGVAIGLALTLLLKGLNATSQTQKEQIGSAALFLASVGLVVVPWVIRNSLVFGIPVIGSTLTGYNVFRMNYFIANASFSPHYVGSTEAYQAVKQLVQGRNLSGIENEAQMQAFYMKAGLQIILQHPLQYISLSIYRFLPLWFNTSVDAAYGIKPGILGFVSVIQQAILLMGIIVGMIRNRRELWPFILCLVLGCAAYMAVDAQLRYLVDLMPAVVILAASALTDLRHPGATRFEPGRSLPAA